MLSLDTCIPVNHVQATLVKNGTEGAIGIPPPGAIIKYEYEPEPALVPK